MSDSLSQLPINLQCSPHSVFPDKEIWRSIKGYRCRYRVSNLGNVQSIRWHGGRGKHKLIKQHLGKSKRGMYYYVLLSKKGEQKRFYVDRLVYETFVGQLPAGQPVMHEDGDLLNSNLNNLYKKHKNVKSNICRRIGYPQPYLSPQEVERLGKQFLAIIQTS